MPDLWGVRVSSLIASADGSDPGEAEAAGAVSADMNTTTGSAHQPATFSMFNLHVVYPTVEGATMITPHGAIRQAPGATTEDSTPIAGPALAEALGTRWPRLAVTVANLTSKVRQVAAERDAAAASNLQHRHRLVDLAAQLDPNIDRPELHPRPWTLTNGSLPDQLHITIELEIGSAAVSAGTAGWRFRATNEEGYGKVADIGLDIDLAEQIVDAICSAAHTSCEAVCDVTVRDANRAAAEQLLRWANPHPAA